MRIQKHYIVSEFHEWYVRCLRRVQTQNQSFLWYSIDIKAFYSLRKCKSTNNIINFMRYLCLLSCHKYYIVCITCRICHTSFVLSYPSFHVNYDTSPRPNEDPQKRLLFHAILPPNCLEHAFSLSTNPSPTLPPPHSRATLSSYNFSSPFPFPLSLFHVPI